MIFQRKQVPLEVILKSKVVVNTSIRTEEAGDSLLIVIPRRKSRGLKLLSIFVFIPKEQKVVLDELGREVFEDCRRELVVSEIIANFQKNHNVSDQYGRKSVVRYLDSLARKGVIAFLVEPENAPGEGETGGVQSNGRD